MSAATLTIGALIEDTALWESLAEAEAAGSISEELYQTLADLGMFGLGVPQEHGGAAVPLRARLPLHARIARASASLHSVLIVHEMAAHAIARFAPRACQERWLEPMARGRQLGAFALTEPGGGSSFEQVSTAAEPCASGVRIDGAKRWISSGRRAGVIVTFARSASGLVALIVPSGTAGVTAVSSPPLAALRAASIADLHFDGCTVHAEAQIALGDLAAIRLATSCLTIGRVLVGVGALAVGAAALEATVARARDRVVGNAPLASRELVKQTTAEEYVQLQAAQLLVEAAADALDARASDAARAAVMAKLLATKAASDITGHAVALHGADGLAADALVQRLAAEAAVYRTIEGNTEALSSALGAEVLRRGTHFDATLGAAPQHLDGSREQRR